MAEACNKDTCAMEQRISVLERENEKNSSTHQKFYDRFEEIGKEQVRTETTYATILEKIGSLENKVDAIVAKPA